MATAAQAPACRFEPVDWALCGLSLTCGLAYLFGPARLVALGLPFAVTVVIKGLSIAPLAIIALRQLARPDHWLLGMALLFSTLGDVFLGLRGEQWFTPGLSSFLIAHLFYVTLFACNKPKPFAVNAARYAAALLLFAFAVAMFVRLWSHLGVMKAPVVVYMIAITGMGVTAALAGFRAGWVVAGAALFICSDSMIAFGKFLSPVPYGNYLIWVTYYIAQAFIAFGVIREKQRG
jgi:uncharacterized membrane protein YhhN